MTNENMKDRLMIEPYSHWGIISKYIVIVSYIIV